MKHVFFSRLDNSAELIGFSVIGFAIGYKIINFISTIHILYTHHIGVFNRKKFLFIYFHDAVVNGNVYHVDLLFLFSRQAVTKC